MDSKDLDSLKPDLKNPRRMSDFDGKALAVSLDEFGDLGVIVNNTRLDKVVGGHMRMETILAKDSGAKIFITERLKEQDPTGTTAWGYVIYEGRRLAYREVDWDEVKHGEANIAANKISGEWDIEKLGEYDQWLLDQGSDLTKTGQTKDEIDRLLGNEPEKPADENEKPRLTFRLTEHQRTIIEQALQLMKSKRNLQDEGNDDMDGNALFYICLEYVEAQDTNQNPS